MYYSGEFRSLDQSVDPKGQLYKVIILTGYDPSTLNTQTIFGNTSMNVGPYPVVERLVGFAQKESPDPQHPGEIVPIYYNVPVDSTNLVMTDHPVIIDYVGDGKLQKPYRCSTAAISFIQSSLNTDFINSLGQRVLVFVLKWKNEVVMTNSSTYLNTKTNDMLVKTVKTFYDSTTHETNTYYNNFLPWARDRFCYDVVWAGFSMPEMLNTAFDHEVDKFTLNCQDALSTLKYTRYTRTAQTESLMDTLFRGLLTLGIYKDVYVTNNVHFPNLLDFNAHQDYNSGPAFEHIHGQQDNYFDEDGIPMFYLGVFEYMAKYLGLTMIPMGSELFITSDHCIGNGHTSYRKYSFDPGSFIWALPASNPTYDSGVDIDCENTIWLNGDRFCSSSTTLSSDVMTNKVSVECDEMRPDPLLPDLNDITNYEPEIPAQDQPMAVNLWDRYSTTTPGRYDEENYHYFESYLNRVATGVVDIKFFTYPQTSTNANSCWNTSDAHETNDSDLVVTHNRKYAGQSNDNPTPDWVQGVWAPPAADYGATGIPSCLACLVDYADTTVANRTEVPTTFSLRRAIMCATPANYMSYRYSAAGTTYPHDWDDKSTYWNPMVYLKSKPFLGNGKQYFNLSGIFTYFGSPTSVATMWYPCKISNRESSYFRFSKNYNYVWMKIRLGNYWLTDNGRGDYSWTETESFVRIWCDDSGLNANTDWRWTEFNIETTIRGVDGITLELPIDEGYAEPCEIEIWIDRPLGPGNQDSFCAHSTLIDGFEVNIYSDDYVESRRRRNPDRDNTRYENEVVSGAIEEAPTIGLIHSSCDTAGLSYAETFFRTRRLVGDLFEVVNKTNPKVLNDGSGYYGIPEKVRVDTDKHQGITPSIKIDTGVFIDDVKMYSRILWDSQLHGHNFIIDSMKLDFEYEQCDLTLLEVKSPDNSYSNIDRMNATRNYYRTNDIIFDGHVATPNPVRLTITRAMGTTIFNYNDDAWGINTIDPTLGTSSLNMDWATGQFRLTVPYSGDLSAVVNNNQVVVTTV